MNRAVALVTSERESPWHESRTSTFVLNRVGMATVDGTLRWVDIGSRNCTQLNKPCLKLKSPLKMQSINTNIISVLGLLPESRLMVLYHI